MNTPPLLSMAGPAHLSARRPWRILGFWLVLLVPTTIAAASLGDALTTEMRQRTYRRTPLSRSPFRIYRGVSPAQ